MKLSEIAERLDLDMEDIKELMGLYVETTASDLKELKMAVESKNSEEVHKKAHSITGASGNLGLTELYEIAVKINSVARGNSLDGIESMVEEFSEKFNQLIKDLDL